MVFLVCDFVHSLIEREARKSSPMSVAHPQMWREIIAACRPSQPFKIVELKRKEVLDFHFKAGRGGSYASKFKGLKYSVGCSWKITRNSLCVRNSFIDNDCTIFKYDKFNYLYKRYQPPIAYPLPLKLTFKKKMDLLEFVNEARIPVEYLNFFESLPADDAPTISQKEALTRKILKLRDRHSFFIPEDDIEESD